ncbi:aminoglycoside phosphotransferase family protein [Nonomuraea sp. NPDC003804]|uniref:aminoglycoside phosphotransferase family protein n=1 Tax=Nonomuraea sp. NPDC003804 TaxID=3154547 RepID=UPI0033B3543A
MKLIARGRDADVYALDGSKVLRRYRSGGPTEQEARLMAHLAACGFPVPRVHEATGTDMVLDRVPGPTMLETLTRRPWQAGSLGRLLGALHDRLHALPAPHWLPTRFASQAGNRILHLDFHPGNVILSPAGPVVIDWRNAAAGDPAADVAMTLVTIGNADLPGWVLRTVRGRLLRGMRRGTRTDPGPRTGEVTRARLADPNLTSGEAARLARRMANPS